MSATTASTSTSAEASADHKGGAILEEVVGKVSEFAIGQTKECKVGEVSLLVIRSKDGFHACGNKCSHYGAPFAKGVINGNSVICPWHGACFSFKSGDIEEAPALDAIPIYHVEIVGENIKVRVPQTVSAKQSRLVPVPVKCNPQADPRVFVVVGGGPAGLVAVQTLRESHFQGKIVLITAENTLPYDRIRLSKNPAMKLNDMLLRPAEYFQDNDIEIKFQTQVTAVDVESKTLSLSDGSKLQYNQVLVATGSRPRQLLIPGSHLQNIFYIREPQEAGKLAALVESGQVKNAVIVGSGFIGMELAVWLQKQNINITIVNRQGYPMERVFGAEIGKFFQRLHEEKGVKFLSGVLPTQYEGKDKVELVHLSDGNKLPADLVIVGIGALPNTEFLKSGGKIQLAADGGVVVDNYLQSSSGIFAAGDIATFPYVHTGQLVRIEHWDVAQQQARVAAKNMLQASNESNNKRPYTTTPFFWTMQHGSLRYCGHCGKPDEIIFQGKLEDRSFVAFYVEHGKITAVASYAKDPVVSAASQLFSVGKMLTVDQAKAGIDIVSYLSQLQA